MYFCKTLYFTKYISCDIALNSLFHSVTQILDLDSSFFIDFIKGHMCSRRTKIYMKLNDCLAKLCQVQLRYREFSDILLSIAERELYVNRFSIN